MFVCVSILFVFKGVIHKDIKPGNLLLALDDTLKISDLGVAEEVDRYSTEDWCRFSQGTPKFQPPEVASGSSGRFRYVRLCFFAFDICSRGYPVDIWACGVSLFNFISGEYPFEGDVIMRLYDNIAHQPLEMPKCVQLECSLQELLRRMLDKNPIFRATIDNIKASAWFRRQLPSIVAERIHVPSCNTAPAHRPLSVYGPLQQMFGVDSGEIDTNHQPVETTTTTQLMPLTDSTSLGVDTNDRGVVSRTPKRNRSL